MAQPVTHPFAGVGPGPAFAATGHFNAQLSGTFSAKMRLESSLDQGVTWVTVSSDAYGSANGYTAPMRVRLHEPEAGALHRWFCETHASGTPVGRLSQ